MFNNDQDFQFNFKQFFIPLTTRKAICIITIVGFISFFNGVFNGFVGDDQQQVTNNPIIQSIQNLPIFFNGSTFYYGGSLAGFSYRPLLSTTFSIIYSLFGASSLWFHLFLVLVYIVNTCLIFLVCKYFFKQSIALILALIFLVHPINSEVSFYISDTQEVLFFFFGIISVYILQRGQSWKAIFTTSICLFLSLLSKETGVLFICISLLYLKIFKGREFFRLLWCSIAIFAIYVSLRIHAIGIFPHLLPNAPIETLGFLTRSINMPAIFFFYVQTFFFPIILSSSHTWIYTHLNGTNFFLPLVLDLLFITAIIFFANHLYKKNTKKHFLIYMFFAIWFFLGMVFHLQIFPLDQTVADRWFYFPIVGVLGMLGVFLEAVNVNVKNKWVVLIVSTIVLLLLLRTFIRSFDWRDNQTLAGHDITVSQEAYDLEEIYGYEFLKQGDFQKAKLHFEKSIALYPRATSYNNLGVTYMNLKNYPKAKESFQKAIQLSDYYMAYESMASLDILTGNIKDFKKFITVALKKFPYDAKLWEYLAFVDYNTNDIQEAKYAISLAYKYDPNAEISNIYSLIMNNQPLHLKYTTNPQ